MTVIPPVNAGNIFLPGYIGSGFTTKSLLIPADIPMTDVGYVNVFAPDGAGDMHVNVDHVGAAAQPGLSFDMQRSTVMRITPNGAVMFGQMVTTEGDAPGYVEVGVKLSSQNIYFRAGTAPTNYGHISGGSGLMFTGQGIAAIVNDAAQSTIDLQAGRTAGHIATIAMIGTAISSTVQIAAGSSISPVSKLVVNESGAIVVGVFYTSTIAPSIDSTTAIEITKADGTTAIMTFDTTNSRVGIGATPVAATLEVVAPIGVNALRVLNTAAISPSSGGTIQIGAVQIPTAVDQRIGGIGFMAYSTGTTYVNGAVIAANTEAAWSGASAGARLVFRTTAVGSVSHAERARITGAGTLLHGLTTVAGTDAAGNAEFGGTVRLPILAAPADSTTAIQITKADGATAVMTFDTTNGRVGIGMTPINQPFEVLSATAGVGIRSLNSLTPASNAGGIFIAVTTGTPSGATQRLGGLYFGGITTGTTYALGAAVQGFAMGAWSGTDSNAVLTFATTPIASTSRTEKTRITGAGTFLHGKTTVTGTDAAGNMEVNGQFGCNGVASQAMFASGGAAPAGGTGTAAGGYDTVAHRDALITLVNNIRTALVNNGIMS